MAWRTIWWRVGIVAFTLAVAACHQPRPGGPDAPFPVGVATGRTPWRAGNDMGLRYAQERGGRLPVVEVIAIVTTPSFHDTGNQQRAESLEVVVRRGHGREEAELRVQETMRMDRHFFRPMTREELASVRGAVRDSGVEAWPACDPGPPDAAGLAYVHLTLGVAKRVDLHRWGESQGEATQRRQLAGRALAQRLGAMAAAQPLKVRYVSHRLETVELVFAQPWDRATEVRVVAGKVWVKLLAPYLGASPRWCEVRHGQAREAAEGEQVPERETAWKIGEDWDKAIDHTLIAQRLDGGYPYGSWDRATGPGVAVVGGKLKDGREGTFLLQKGKAPEQLLNRVVEWPLVTPDGHWLLGSVAGQLVQVDLVARKEVAVAVPREPSEGHLPDQWIPYTYMPETGRVLIMKRRGAPWESWGHDYVDFQPATGERRAAWGADEADWISANPQRRRLQPTADGKAYWAAGPHWVNVHEPLPRRLVEGTHVARLDVHAEQGWAVEQTVAVPRMVFGSDTMWVDEAGGWVYFVWDGLVWRVSLKRPELGGLFEDVSGGSPPAIGF